MNDKCLALPLERIKDNWSTDGKFLLWGTGETGRDFFSRFHDKIEIVGFIDSNSKKQGEREEFGDTFLKVYSFEGSQNQFPGAKIIITVDWFWEIASMLEEKGYEKNRDFYESKVFKSLYYKFSENTLWFSFVNLFITDRCNLKCVDCFHSIPYIKKHTILSLEELKENCDKYFAVVDRVGRFKVLGGEPLLYPQLPVLLEYLGEQYGNRIENLDVTTNGTCELSDEFIRVCRKYHIRIEVSDYRNMLSEQKRNRVERTIDILKKSNVYYCVDAQREWIDFGIRDRNDPETDEEILKKRFTDCSVMCHTLYKNRVYACVGEIGAILAEWCQESSDDYVSLDCRPKGDICFSEEEIHSIRDELLALDVNISRKGYLSCCSSCRGYHSKKYILAARQLK